MSVVDSIRAVEHQIQLELTNLQSLQKKFSKVDNPDHLDELERERVEQD
jgi:hypothetical protein